MFSSLFEAPLHPKIVHLPLGLAMVMPIVFVLLAAAVRRQWLPPRAWWMGVALAAFTSLGAFAAAQLGDSDALRVEKVLDKKLIDEHDAAAGQFQFALGVTLAIAVLGGILRDPRARLGAHTATALLSVVAFGLGVRTGHLGGNLVYKHGAAAVYGFPNRLKPSHPAP